MGSGRGIMAVRQHAMPDGELATGPYAAAFQTRLPWRNLTVHSRGRCVFTVTSGVHPVVRKDAATMLCMCSSPLFAFGSRSMPMTKPRRNSLRSRNVPAEVVP